MAGLGFDQSSAAGHKLQPVVVGVVAQVRGDRDDVEVTGQVFRPVVDEDRVAVLEGQLRGQVTAIDVATVLGAVVADEVVDPELSTLRPSLAQ